MIAQLPLRAAIESGDEQEFMNILRKNPDLPTCVAFDECLFVHRHNFARILLRERHLSPSDMLSMASKELVYIIDDGSSQANVLETVKFLIKELGAKPNEENLFTPSSKAVNEDFPLVAEYLLENGATLPNYGNVNDYSVLSNPYEVARIKNRKWFSHISI
jgi:hypothetical protein